MNTFTHERFTRVRADVEGEGYRCPAGSPNFYLVPETITAEFADTPALQAGEALRKAEVCGQRYRVLKAGPKHVGYACIRFGSGGMTTETLMGSSVAWLIWQMYDAACGADDAEVARRHAEREAHSAQRKAARVADEIAAEGGR